MKYKLNGNVIAMSYEIIIRRARDEDARQRVEIVRLGLLSHKWDAFWFFLFQELTLEGVVLCGAVLFIFCGASPTMCAALIPAATALVALVVTATHHMLAASHVQRINKELFGIVAEARGGLLLRPPPGPVPIHNTIHLSPQQSKQHSQIIGSVSISEFCGPQQSGWLHALAVHPEWQRRGVGRALVAAARVLSTSAGLTTLETVTSHLQPSARALLHASGWECRGTYDRPLMGAALTLPLARLGLSLPRA